MTAAVPVFIFSISGAVLYYMELDVTRGWSVLYRLFGVKCSRCGLDFDRNQLVMRARDRVYHVECFRCVVCQLLLVPGSEFALRPVDSGLVCRTDYDAICDVAMPSLDSSAGVSVDGFITPHESDDATSPASTAHGTSTGTIGAVFYGNNNNNNNIENEIETKTRTG
jgi:LIM domain